MNVYYEELLIGQLTTNRSLTIDEALQALGFDEQAFKDAQGFDNVDYNEFRLEAVDS